MSMTNKRVATVMDVLNAYQAEIDSLTLKLSDVWPKPMKFEGELPIKRQYKIPTDSDLSYSNCWFCNKDYYSNYKEITDTKSLDARLQVIQEQINKYESDLKTTLEKDLIVVEHNKAIHQKVIAMMKDLGIPDTYTKREYGRTGKPKDTRESAGYLGDLTRNIPISPRMANIAYEVDSLRRTAQTKYDEIKRKAIEAERQAAKEKQAAERMHHLAMLRVKYTPDNPLSDKYDILEGCLSKNKYLMLAHYLQANRNSWVDGCSYAEQGLNNFTVETAEDKEIYDSLSALCEDFEDGRVFRDCEYNYGVLFGMVEDKTLLNDYQEITKDWEY